MPTKAWPATVKKKDSKPSTYHDLSVETQRIVALGGHVYFFVYCWDMDSDSKLTSILFRAPASFDAPAERLSAIDSEIVDLLADGDGLLALENAVGREGYGVVHRLEGAFEKPKRSTSIRVKGANIFRAIGRGDADDMYVGGDALHRFDGKAWKPVTVEPNFEVAAIASNGKLTVAVGKGSSTSTTAGTVVTLTNGTASTLVTGGDASSGVHVAADGTISVAGRRGTMLQGQGAKLAKLASFDTETDMHDVTMFKGTFYWSASGNASGVHAQKGTQLSRVFDDQNCFALTATDDYLFVASENGLLRYDGKAWKRLDTKYDNGKGVWAVAPVKAKK